MSESNLPEQLHSRPGTAVANRSEEAEGLDASDILIPRMKVAQKISRVVDDNIAEYGSVHVLASRDDMEPIILAEPPKGEALSKPVRFYVLDEPRKGWSWKPAVEGGEWRGTRYPNLSLVANQEPRNVRRTYDYLLTVPGAPQLPVRFLMHGAWGGQAAKIINTQIMLDQARGLDPSATPYKLQVKFTSSPKDGQKRPFVQAVVAVDKVSAKDLKADQELVELHKALGAGSNVRELDDDDGVAQAQPVDAPSLD